MIKDIILTMCEVSDSMSILSNLCFMCRNTSLDDSIVTNLGGGNNNRLSAADTTTSFLNTSDLDASCLVSIVDLL